ASASATTSFLSGAPIPVRISPPSKFSIVRFTGSLDFNNRLPAINRKKLLLLPVAVGPPPSELYSAEELDLTPENVDKVLDDVRPYLIADGGNVEVASVENGVVSLKLQGSCGSCPSSTTTMKMGIERALKEKFGEALKDVRQIHQISDDQTTTTTIEAVDSHLDILRPAIKNYGGSVRVVSVEEGNCSVNYNGPDSIGIGIKAAIKEKFPDITHVHF
ncbi:hypothetical protein M569_06470, partial [Genlisea aurea]